MFLLMLVCNRVQGSANPNPLKLEVSISEASGMEGKKVTAGFFEGKRVLRLLSSFDIPKLFILS